METIGERLRRIRRDRRLSLDELALQVGSTRQTINAVEVGKNGMSFYLAIELAEVLDVSLDVLATREEFIPIHDESIIYYSCTEASRMSGAGVDIIYELVRGGYINAEKIDGKLKFSMDEIQRIKRYRKLDRKGRRELWKKEQSESI